MGREAQCRLTIVPHNQAEQTTNMYGRRRIWHAKESFCSDTLENGCTDSVRATVQVNPLADPRSGKKNNSPFLFVVFTFGVLVLREYVCILGSQSGFVS